MGPTIVNHTLSGAISGKAAAANTVVVDAPDFLGTLDTGPTYSGMFFNGPWPSGDIIATEVDPIGNLVNGVILRSQTFGMADITMEDVSLPSPALVPVKETLTINLPSTGALTGAKITHVGESTVLEVQISLPTARTVDQNGR